MITKVVGTSATEQRILDTATRLEAIANRLDDIFGVCGRTIAQIKSAGKTAEVSRLNIEGTELYGSIIPDASALYHSWPKPKQVRARRELRSEMTKAGAWGLDHPGVYGFLEGLKQGNKNDLHLPMYAETIKTATYFLRGVVKENENPDTTDVYWERIRNAVLIEPRPGCLIATLFRIEDGEGEFTEHAQQQRIKTYDQDVAIPKIVSGLIGREKVIFFPIKTVQESASFETACRMSTELPFEIEVRNHPESPAGEVIGKLVAEEFSPFREENARRVIQFLKDNVLIPLRT